MASPLHLARALSSKASKSHDSGLKMVDGLAVNAARVCYHITTSAHP